MYRMEWVELDKEDKTRILAIMLGYAVVKDFNFIYIDLDIFYERTAVVEAQIIEAEYWIWRFERVRKLMNERDKESYDSVRAELLENNESNSEMIPKLI